ncbi:MAG: hypothetical protein JJU02_10700 [Cryomorphaceae bacterium]|nr:hypothetical protein [Cryomorphaceae bacterium]
MIKTKLKSKYPIDSIHIGIVIQQMPYGLFVKFEEREEDCLGLVQITDIGKSEFWSLDDLPKIGDLVKVQVIAYTEDDRNQIWLKPAE